MKEMNKKIFSVFFFFLLIGVFSLQFASSAMSLRDISESTIDAFVQAFEPVLAVLFGGTTWSGLLLFEKLLILIIFIAVVYVAIGQIPAFEDNKGVRWAISIIVPLIGIRALDYDWLMAILLQYKLLAIVMIAFLPFIIFFFFIHKTLGEHDAMRKIAWIFFIVVYLGLWATSEMQHSDIYFWTMLASLIFLLFDGTIHNYYVRKEMEEAGSINKYEHIAKLRRDISETQALMQNNHIPERIGKKIIKKKNNQITWFMKHG